MSRNTDGCVGRSKCNFGCPSGAKLSVDRSYLPRAVDAGARIVANCRVLRVLRDGDRVTGVRAVALSGTPRTPGAQLEIRGKVVVMAAGAAHTPRLLMRSGFHRGLRHIGRNMTLHPAFRVTARFEERVEGWRGALQSTWSDAYEEEGVTLMSVFVPPGTIAGAIPGFGSDFMRRAQQMPHLAMYGGLIHDEGGGRIWNVPGSEPLMTYRMSRKDRATIPRVIRRIGDAFVAAGAKELYIPVLGHAAVDADAFARLDLEHVPARRFECSSQHPLGTCRIGTDRGNSVVDTDARVWGLDNLYVVDGGTLPSSLGVNPQLSIMAMAMRYATRMRERGI